jgi:hypothetical protein
MANPNDQSGHTVQAAEHSGCMNVGLVLGAVLGVVLGLLYLPVRGLLPRFLQSGRDLQQQMGTDPVTSSLEEMKAMARARREGQSQDQNQQASDSE